MPTSWFLETFAPAILVESGYFPYMWCFQCRHLVVLQLTGSYFSAVVSLLWLVYSSPPFADMLGPPSRSQRKNFIHIPEELPPISQQFLVIKTGISTTTQLPLWCSFLSKCISIIQVKKCKYRQGIIYTSNYKHQQRGEAPKRTWRDHGVHPLHEGARISGGLSNSLWNTSVGFLGIPQMLWCVLHARLPCGTLE